MRLFLVERVAHPDYDEYGTMLVRAGSAEEATEVALAKHLGLLGMKMVAAELTATELPTEGDPGVLMAEFHAG